MKTGLDLMRNSALAVLFALGTVGLAACGDEGGDAPAPAEPAEKEDSYGGTTMDDAKDAAEDAMEDAGEAMDDAGKAMEDAAEDTMDTMEEGADKADDSMKDAMDKME